VFQTGCLVFSLSLSLCMLAFQFLSRWDFGFSLSLSRRSVPVPVLCVHDALIEGCLYPSLRGPCLSWVSMIYRLSDYSATCVFRLRAHVPPACPSGIALPPCDFSLGLPSAGTYAAAFGASVCVDCGAGKFAHPPGSEE
jgi:hypothetical protein